MNNENQNKLDELQSEGFKPMSEEDEKNISGGVRATLGTKCSQATCAEKGYIWKNGTCYADNPDWGNVVTFC